MCGIIGYTGAKNALKRLLDGLASLEYRGYDSSGVALLGDGVRLLRAEGKLSRLVARAEGFGLGEQTGIGHTRWATHGAPTEENAHPHTDEGNTLAVVHNGIIENHGALRRQLTEAGVVFRSKTDTEVVPHLLSTFRKEGLDPLAAMAKLVGTLRGSYALAVVFYDRPNRIYAVRRDSPLYLATGKDGSYLASDLVALAPHARAFYTLKEGEIGVLTPTEVAFFDREGIYAEHLPEKMPNTTEGVDKGGYATFMEKEICEVPKAVERTINAPLPHFHGGQRVYLVGCGSAYHAALVGELLLEEQGVPARAMIASEFRYRPVPLSKDTPVILISQSGETADTLAALRRAKERGATTYAVVNVATSAMAREADFVCHTKAGVEVAVATTKAYCAQLACLFAWLGGEMQTKVVTSCEAALEIPLGEVVPYLARAAHAFFIGRGIDSAIAREGCLKLKEISYLHAESYEAGELKHGTISLIEKGTPVIAILTDPRIAEKTLSNMEEVGARGGRIWAVVTEGLAHLTRDFPSIVIPSLSPPYAALPAAVVLERISLKVALLRGHDPDKPRNLAKSVTVE